MNVEKKLSKIKLSSANERTDFSVSIDELRKIEQHNNYLKKVDNEQFKQISVNCIRNSSMRNTTEQVSNEFPLKVFFVFFAVLFTYYSVYYVAYVYITNRIDPIYYYTILFIFLSGSLLLLVLFIYRKDFGKVQLLIYTAIYGLVSLLGVLTLLLNLFPFTSYQVINMFIVILFIQTLIFVITVPITRKLVCRIDIQASKIKSIDF